MFLASSLVPLLLVYLLHDSIIREAKAQICELMMGAAQPGMEASLSNSSVFNCRRTFQSINTTCIDCWNFGMLKRYGAFEALPGSPAFYLAEGTVASQVPSAWAE